MPVIPSASTPANVAKPIIKKTKTKCFYCDKMFVSPTTHIVSAHNEQLTYDMTHDKPIPAGFSHYKPKE